MQRGKSTKQTRSPSRGEGSTSFPGARTAAWSAGGSIPYARRLSRSVFFTDDFTQSPSTFFMPAAAAAVPSVVFALFKPIFARESGESSGERGARAAMEEKAVETAAKWGWMNCSPPR